MSVVIDLLLALCVLLEVLAVTGLVVMRTTMQRLHFTGPATVVAPVIAGVAVALGTHATASQGAKGLLIALALVAFSGVLAAETAQAAIAHDERGS